MKIFTHPATSSTLIRTKDGSSYVKHWSYPQSTLMLESDFKKMEVSKFRHSIDLNKFIEITDKTSNKFSQIPQKQQAASFWVSIEK